MLSWLSFRIQKCCPVFLWFLSMRIFHFSSCMEYKEMQCMSCSKVSVHCPLHPWAVASVTTVQNENSAQNAPGDHSVSANAECGQEVAALASCCCSGLGWAVWGQSLGRSWDSRSFCLTFPNTKEGKDSANWKTISSNRDNFLPLWCKICQVLGIAVDSII